MSNQVYRGIKFAVIKRQEVPRQFKPIGPVSLSSSEQDALANILNALGRDDLIPFNPDTVTLTYLPSVKGVLIHNPETPAQDLSLSWESGDEWFRARDRYLGIPTCCTKYWLGLPQHRREAPAPFYYTRCVRHAGLAADQWFARLNKTRIHPIEASRQVGIPKWSRVILDVTWNHLKS
jgi:hypothetical protein